MWQALCKFIDKKLWALWIYFQDNTLNGQIFYLRWSWRYFLKLFPLDDWKLYIRSNFLLSKTFFFSFFFYYHKTDLIFFKSKDLVLCDKHMSEFFYLQKPLFSTYHKTDLVFWQIKINFFLPIKIDMILFKRKDFIHK